MTKRKSIHLAELDRLLETPGGVTIIDVRSEEEYNEKHIPSAINLPVEDIELKKVVFDPWKPIVTVCGHGGGRSDRAAALIREIYHIESSFLEGGTFGWYERKVDK